MKLEINIKKRQVYLLSFLIVVAFGILFVQGQGVTNFGHNSDQVEIVIEGTTKTLQDSYDDSSLRQIDCMSWRSATFGEDAVSWCNTDYPTLVHCSIIDNQAPNGGPTLIASAGSSSGQCQSEGLCSATNIRADLGDDTGYLEIVKKNDGIIQGCWQYDYGHARKDYQIELVCCK
ncbi:hypothetical protein HOF78_04190 [Candidatus Woesearchaeota archaeon]|jgi:hypothetical protein|nr:hypothetical protein [Candidatus Woesearchaeota archaeon]MBT6045145.1 hypothetical protein [Candidatus Woesearchaeota archaeon]